MRERTFQGEVEKSFRLLKGIAHYQKIPDSFPPAPTKCWKCGSVVKPRMNFTPPKPYDGFAAVKGAFLAIEFKMLTEARGWPLSSLSAHQVKNLIEVERAGGSGWVWINIRTKTAPRINEVRTLQVGKIIRIKNDLERKSIPFDRLMDEFIPIERFRVPDPVVKEYCRHFGYKNEEAYRNLWNVGEWLHRLGYIGQEPNLEELWNVSALQEEDF